MEPTPPAASEKAGPPKQRFKLKYAARLGTFTRRVLPASVHNLCGRGGSGAERGGRRRGDQRALPGGVARASRVCR